jgi:LPXTG-site transpeptidase (sortase) family protein
MFTFPLKNKLTLKDLALLGLVSGALLLGSGLWLRWRHFRFSFTTTLSVAEAELRQPLPTHLQIASVNINLPIVESQIQDGVWQVTDGVANHLATSARPGEGSNIVVYGHNQWSVLGGLQAVQIGDEIKLTLETNEVKVYQVVSTQVVSPDEVKWVMPTAQEILTIYTCAGWWDNQRLVVQAQPE